MFYFVLNFAENLTFSLMCEAYISFIYWEFDLIPIDSVNSEWLLLSSDTIPVLFTQI